MSPSKSANRSQRRARRTFPKEFKDDIVKVCLEGKESVAAVARRFELSETAVRGWVRQAEADASGGASGPLTTEERDELQRLRRENKRLVMEREILKKAAAFFAKENS